MGNENLIKDARIIQKHLNDSGYPAYADVIEDLVQNVKRNNGIEATLDSEIEFAKGTGMSQFVMGLQQAKKVLVGS